MKPIYFAFSILPLATFIIGYFVGNHFSSENRATSTVLAAKPGNFSHAFDTLSKWELKNISVALRERFPQDFPRVHEVRLLTSKSEWKRRLVEVICRYPHPKGTFKVTIDVANSEVLHQGEYLAVQPVLQSKEISRAKKALRESSLVRKIVEEKGLSMDDVISDEDTVGFWGESENSTRRMISLEMYVSANTSNWFARPLNLRFVVDVDSLEIVNHFSEPAPIPTWKGSTLDPPRSSRKGPKRPVLQTQPAGVNFKINGSQITWELWRFRLRLNQRVGPILSSLSVHDFSDKSWHSIAHEISLSEMFVPYMDVSDMWYYKTYFDVGEYGVGTLAQPLNHLSCGENAYYFSFHALTESGDIEYLENVTCIFERDTMDPVWHHGSPRDDIPSQTRKNLELVVRTIPMVGNYDYIIDFVFSLDANMKIRVGATGSDAFRAGPPPGEPPMGSKAQEDLTAPFHDHFVNFRLDLDVDGRNNSFIVQKVRKVSVGDDEGPRKSRWAVEESLVRFESEARLKPHRETVYKISNPNGRGIEFVATNSINQLLSVNDFPAKRASFTQYPLWVTQYDASERYAAGEFPNQGACADGLESFSDRNRSLEHEDLVLWYSVGFHHLTRAEDFPVLNTKWAQFMLKPYNFFLSNVAINLTTNY